MRRKTTLVMILIILGFAVFLFVPVTNYTRPTRIQVGLGGAGGEVVVVGHYAAQVSPSYFYFKCGIVYNLAVVYTYNGSQSGYQVGVDGWFCGSIDSP